MRTHIAKSLAWQLAQEDQTPTEFDEIEVVENDDSGWNSVVRATYHSGYQTVHLVINATEPE